MSASFIPEQRPTKSEARMRATKELNLNVAIRTIRPRTAIKAQSKRLAWRLKPGMAFMVSPRKSLNRQHALARHDLPSRVGLAVFHHDRRRMQRHGRTD